MSAQLIDFHLRQQGINDGLVSIIDTIARAGKNIAHEIRYGNHKQADSQNSSGENQLAIDILSDEIFCKYMGHTGLISRFASEEQEDEVVILGGGGQYAVAFDPLDGSSLVDSNLAIGSIFCVFEGNQFIGKTGRDIAAAGYIVYGPRTLLVVATRQGIFLFSENYLGEFVCDHASLHLAPNGKIFAPGNLRAIVDNPKYAKLVEQFSQIPLTLRYSGGMVPDIHALLAKGGGIFCYPGGTLYPNGKLRMLFELMPFAFIAEAAGGVATDQFGTPLLDLPLTDLHQRGSILIGSEQLVQHALGQLN